MQRPRAAARNASLEITVARNPIAPLSLNGTVQESAQESGQCVTHALDWIGKQLLAAAIRRIAATIIIARIERSRKRDGNLLLGLCRLSNFRSLGEIL